MTTHINERAKAKAEENIRPAVEEMCAHLLSEKLLDLRDDHIDPAYREQYRKAALPPYYFNDGGFRRLAQTRDDFERLLAPWKRALGQLMLKVPRNEGESIAAYHERLTQSGEDWWGRFERMKNWLAHIHRVEGEERVEREREAAQRKREEEERERAERARRAELERQATIDPNEVKRLLAVIAEAREIEELLALHKRAESARGALRSMYAKERDACAALGKPVPERSVPEAAGTIEDGFAIGFLIGSQRSSPIPARQPIQHSPLRISKG
jgi:hypothetical protein